MKKFSCWAYYYKFGAFSVWTIQSVSNNIWAETESMTKQKIGFFFLHKHFKNDLQNIFICVRVEALFENVCELHLR